MDDDVTPDDDNEPNDLDEGGDDIEGLLEEDEEDDIVYKVPLMLFIDLDSTGGSMYSDCMIELAAKVIGYPILWSLRRGTILLWCTLPVISML